MLAPANYCFLHQELCLFVCLEARKKLHSSPLNVHFASVLAAQLKSENFFPKLVASCSYEETVRHNVI